MNPRRVLHRAREGVALDVDETTALLGAADEDLDALCAIATARSRRLEPSGLAI